MKNVRGIIFDADGTLLNSMHIWHDIGARYLKSVDVEPEKNLAEILYPLSLEEGCEYLRKRYALEKTLTEIRESILKIIHDFYFYEVELKDGVKNFLASMREKNIPMLIATSGDRILLNAALERNGIKKYFDAVFTCSELQTTKKEKKIFLECAKFLGLEPCNVAVFEDSLIALETAKAAGFITFGVEDNSNIDDRKKIIEVADYLINFERK